MLLIPAIDLKDGHCVRLKQGDMDQATVFSEDPAEMARHWLAQGARRLHLVDLNGAFAGKPKNEAAVKAILGAVREFAAEHEVDEIPVQLGGGIRDLDTIERYLDDGLSLHHHRHRGGQESRLSARRLQRLSGPDHRRPRRQGRQGGDRRLEQAVRPRSDRPGEEIRGLRLRSDRLHRHRPRRHDGRRQHRCHRQAGAQHDDSGHRLGRRAHRQGCRGAVRGAGRRHRRRDLRPRDLRRHARSARRRRQRADLLCPPESTEADPT